MSKSRYDTLAHLLRRVMLKLFQSNGLWGIDALRRHARRAAREDGIAAEKIDWTANNTLSNFLSILKTEGAVTTARNFTFAVTRLCRLEITSISITLKHPDGRVETISSSVEEFDEPMPTIPGKRHPPLEPEDPAES